ncbi:NTP transferase domain-containing protein [candidate division KSB1 bacterium]|nr:NTP transferase domain-containing protein [candidate division KSB1 bacterium]
MYAVIMAGGEGTRFWPRSRFKHPKQLLQIIADKTMLQSTVERLDSVVDVNHTYIVSTQVIKDEIKRQIPFLKPENLIIEPKGKNTAPCIGLAAVMIKKLDPDAVIAVLPADHHIAEVNKFRQILKAAEKVAKEDDRLVTIGINPTYPSTGYGYIQFNGEIEKIDDIPVYKVKTFAEKPDINTARRFIKSGDFLWNSGIFVWSVKTILGEIEESLPELYDGLVEIEKALGTKSQDDIINKIYCQIKSISIDYGVMEHARNVAVLKGDFGWSDVGTWEEVYQLSQKDENDNVVNSPNFLMDTAECMIDVPDKFVAAIGVNNLIVVETKDALLICNRDNAQNVKDIVEAMKRKELKKHL